MITRFIACLLLISGVSGWGMRAVAQGEDALSPAEQAIWKELVALNNNPGAMDTPAAAGTFLARVEKESPGAAIPTLIALKRKQQANWGAVQGAEARIMTQVRRAVYESAAAVNGRASATHRIFAIGYSGKWSKKAGFELDFDCDFDLTLFSVLKASVDPQNPNGMISELKGLLRETLQVSPENSGIVPTGFQHESKAGVYVSALAAKWAIDNMPVLLVKDPNTGAWRDVAKNKEVFYRALIKELAYSMLSTRDLPELKGRTLADLTYEEARKLLLAQPDLPPKLKALLEGEGGITLTRTAAAGLDYLAHTADVSQGSDPEKQMAKVGKQSARYNHYFIKAMDRAGIDWRKEGSFSEQELELLRACSLLEGAEIAENECIKNLENPNLTDQEFLDQLKAAEGARETRKKALETIERIGGSEFKAEIEKVMLKMIQLTFREGVFEAMGRNDQEMLSTLKELEGELIRIIAEYAGKSPQAVEQAKKALESVQGIIKLVEPVLNSGFKLGEAFNRFKKSVKEPLEQAKRESREYLEQTELGKALKEQVPSWFWEMAAPKEMSSMELNAPLAVAKSLLEPIQQARKVGQALVTPLMFLDMALNLARTLQRTDLDDGQRAFEIGKFAALILVKHAWVIPTMYQAFLAGSYTHLAEEFTICVSYLLCPEAMLPSLVASIMNTTAWYGKACAFDRELEHMFDASVFDPLPGSEPAGWARDPDAIRYEWKGLKGETETYNSETLHRYIRGLAEKDPELMPLSAAHQYGSSEMEAGARLVLGGTVAAAFRYMLEEGDHRLFRENGELAGASAALRKFNYTFMWPFMKLPAEAGVGSLSRSDIEVNLVENTLAADQEQRALQQYGSGYVRYIKNLLKDRATYQQAVVKALSQAIITSFEDEMRARKTLELGLFAEVEKELDSIGTELGIRDELIAAVQKDVHNKAMGYMAEIREKLEKMGLSEKRWGTLLGFELDERSKRDRMRLMSSWVDTYRGVRDLRRLTHMVITRYGVDAVAQKMILYGRMPLVVVPYYDQSTAGHARYVLVDDAPYDARFVLEVLKGARMEKTSPLDRESYNVLMGLLLTARIMELKINQPYALQPAWRQDVPGIIQKPDVFLRDVMKAYDGRCAEALKSRYVSEWLKDAVGIQYKPDLGPARAAYEACAREYVATLKELEEKYRQLHVTLEVQGESKVKQGAEVHLSAEVKPVEEGKDALMKAVKLSWTNETYGVREGRFYQFTTDADKDGPVAVTVTAWRMMETNREVLAVARHTVTVEKLDDPKDKDKKDKDKGVKKDPPGGKKLKKISELTDAERGAFLQCLCRFSTGADPDVYVAYNPKLAPDDECNRSGGGPCFASGFGCWWAFLNHDPTAVSNCLMSVGAYYDPQEAKDFIRKENRKFKKPLQVELKADKMEIDLDDTVTLTAVAQYGIPGYTYEWSGNCEAKGGAAKFTGERPGDFTVSCTVSDTDEESITRSVSIKVLPLTVQLEKLEPPTDQAVVGTKARFKATVMSGPRAAKGSFIFTWQPNPEVDFDPFSGSADTTTALFKRPGPLSIWVDVSRKKGDVEIYSGSSDALEMEILPPGLGIRTSPKDIYIGQEVTLTATNSHDIEGMEYRWELAPGLAWCSQSSDGSEVTVVVQDIWPAPVRVIGETPFYGDELGSAETTVTAKFYEVKARIEGPTFGFKPQVWTSTGLQTVERDTYVGDEMVRISADVKDYPKKDELRWSWWVNKEAGTTLHSTGAGREINVSRHETGTARARAEAFSDKGLLLGQSEEVAFNVTVPADKVEGKADVSVVLACPQRTIPAGQEAQVEAFVSGGKGPYTYSWTGPGVGRGPAYTFKAARPGTYDVKLQVADTKHRQAASNIVITVTNKRAEPPAVPPRPGAPSTSQPPPPTTGQGVGGAITQGATGTGQGVGGSITQGATGTGQGVGGAITQGATGAGQGGGNPAGQAVPPQGAAGVSGTTPGKGMRPPAAEPPPAAPVKVPAAAVPAETAVNESTPAPGASGQPPRLDVRTPVVSPGDKVIVRILNPPSEKFAWVGFYKRESGDKDYIKYAYLNALDNNTYEDVLAPDEPGTYNFRLFKDERYQPLAVSGAIEVK
jgi:hypothetical protein